MGALGPLHPIPEGMQDLCSKMDSLAEKDGLRVAVCARRYEDITPDTDFLVLYKPGEPVMALKFDPKELGKIDVAAWYQEQKTIYIKALSLKKR